MDADDQLSPEFEEPIPRDPDTIDLGSFQSPRYRTEWDVTYHAGFDAVVDPGSATARIPRGVHPVVQAQRLRAGIHAALGETPMGSPLQMALDAMRLDGVALNCGIDTHPYLDHVDFDLVPRPDDRRAAATAWLTLVTAACDHASIAEGKPTLREMCPTALAQYLGITEAIMTPAQRKTLTVIAQSIMSDPDDETRPAEIVRRLEDDSENFDIWSFFADLFPDDLLLDDDDIQEGIGIAFSIGDGPVNGPFAMPEELSELEWALQRFLLSRLNVQHDVVPLGKEDDKTRADRIAALQNRLARTISDAALAAFLDFAPENTAIHRPYDAIVEEARKLRLQAGHGSTNDSHTGVWSTRASEEEFPFNIFDVLARGDEMEIHNHALPHLQGKRFAASRRAVDTGVVPSNWDRFAADQRIFNTTKTGGLLLGDGSASMGWDWNELRREARRSPMLVAAIYSGASGRGRLCIVAQKGRVGEIDKECIYGGNEVDLQALYWASTYPVKGPRVWLSDGYVCGGLLDELLRTEGPRAVLASLIDLGRRGNIVRCSTLESALAYIRNPRLRSDEVFRYDDPHFIPRSTRGGNFSRISDAEFGRIVGRGDLGPSGLN